MTSPTDSQRSLDSSSAACPATNGDAIEVPLHEAYPLSKNGKVLTTFSAGAPTSTQLPSVEKLDTASVGPVPATPSTQRNDAGSSVSFLPALPAAATTTTPSLRSSSVASLIID